MSATRILGVETSCDETSAAVLEDGRVLSNLISSQWVHQQFGGVVPELASRAHLRKIVPLVNQAMEKAGVCFADLDGFAVTYGPGLVGALLVGLNYVKGLAVATGKPFVGVNHIEGHIYSNFLENEELKPPFLCLIVSGGHTQIILVKSHLSYQVLGETRDDAVGEAFDKVAKLLGLPYPGGPAIDELARQGDPGAIAFPRGLSGRDTLDFSYSGLKTAVLNYVQALPEKEKQRRLADICASFQMAAIEVLVQRTIRAARRYQLRQIAVAGGVAANSLLRSLMKQEAEKFHLHVYFPPQNYCTDNAAMIARAGLEYLKVGRIAPLDLNAVPYLRIDGRGF